MSNTILTALVSLIPTICLMLVVILQRRGTRKLRTHLEAKISTLSNLVQTDLLLVNERITKVESGLVR